MDWKHLFWDSWNRLRVAFKRSAGRAGGGSGLWPGLSLCRALLGPGEALKGQAGWPPWNETSSQHNYSLEWRGNARLTTTEAFSPSAAWGCPQGGGTLDAGSCRLAPLVGLLLFKLEQNRFWKAAPLDLLGSQASRPLGAPAVHFPPNLQGLARADSREGWRHPELDVACQRKRQSHTSFVLRVELVGCVRNTRTDWRQCHDFAALDFEVLVGRSCVSCFSCEPSQSSSCLLGM